MKKITVWVAMLLFASFAMGQVMPVQKNMMREFAFSAPLKAQAEKRLVAKAAKDGETPVWTCDFEEGSPEAVIGVLEGALEQSSDGKSVKWQIGGEEAFKTTSFWNGTQWRAFIPFSQAQSVFELSYQPNETPENWAFVDALAPQMIDIQNGAMQNCFVESYIQFNNIDLSATSLPTIRCHQIWRPWNDTRTFIETSTDGITWTPHQVNSERTNGDYHYLGDIDLSIPEVAGQSNVSIRFRISTSQSIHGNAVYCYGIGWQIDDIKIFNTDNVDLILKHALTDFFVDSRYRSDPDPSRYVNNLYNESPYYSSIPIVTYDIDQAHFFHVCVENHGIAATPKINVVVLDPNDDTVYNKVKELAEMQPAEIDTIDFSGEEAFIITEPQIGKYKIFYKIINENETDARLLSDNSDSCAFNITNSLYSRDLGTNDPRSYFTLNNFSGDHPDGEGFGHTFHLFKNDVIQSIDAYIFKDADDEDNTGSVVQCNIYGGDADADNIPDLLQSSIPIEITEANVGSWINFTFEDNEEIMIPEGYEYLEIYVTFIITAYNGKHVAVGYDEYNYVSPTCNMSFFTYDPNGGDFPFHPHQGDAANLTGGLSMRLNLQSNSTDVVTLATDEISVYPNPADSYIKVANAAGKDIVMYNVLGSVVKTVSNATSDQQIDVSNLVGGIYFVKVDNQVVKINVSK